jgi:hypothetical protein
MPTLKVMLLKQWQVRGTVVAPQEPQVIWEAQIRAIPEVWAVRALRETPEVQVVQEVRVVLTLLEHPEAPTPNNNRVPALQANFS